MSGNDRNTSSFDPDALRPSDRDVDRGLRDLASNFKTGKDKNGDDRVWGFKVSRAAAFGINSLYDQFVIPWTQAGSKKIYDQVLKVSQQSEHLSGHAHQIASGVSLALQLGAVIGKPVAEFVATNREHYQERSELYTQVKAAIDGTPADYTNNEVISTAFSRVNASWSRDLVRKVPDMIKVGVQGSVIYGDHKADMAGRLKKHQLTVGDTKADHVDPHMDWFEKRLDQIDAMENASEQRKATLRSVAENELDARRGTGEHAKRDEQPFGVFTPNATGAIGFGTEFAKIAVDEYTEGMVSEKQTAWDKIQILKRFMSEQRAEENPDRVRVNGVQLKKFILDIFQQNEVDRGRGRMGQAVIEQLTPAIDKIAAGVADTTIDANALVHLVGDHKVIMLENGARIFASEEKVEKALEELKGVNTSKEHINKDEFFSNFADPQAAKEVIKTNIASFDGAEKALFVSVFPDELLMHAGMTKDAIKNERKIAHDFIYDVVVADTLELASKAPDELKKLGLAKKEVEAIAELAQDIENGKTDAVKVAVDGADRTVVSAIRTAALHKQLDEKGGHAEKVWSDMIKKGSSLREKIASGELRKQKSDSFAEREERSVSLREREEGRRERSDNESHHGLGA